MASEAGGVWIVPGLPCIRLVHAVGQRFRIDAQAGDA